MVDTWWYRVSILRYWSVLGQNRALVVASVIYVKKIYGVHGVNHQIIQHSEREKMMTDKQTDFPI